jgi:hypothetical protein
MELFGIMLSIPAACAASLLYSLFVHSVVAQSEGWSRAFRIASFVVLVMVALEFVLLARFGAVRLYAATEGLYYNAHLLLFFLGTPALANVLILRSKGDRVSKAWLAAAVPCTILAFVLVLIQYDVSDKLFDDEGTPYSINHK